MLSVFPLFSIVDLISMIIVMIYVTLTLTPTMYKGNFRVRLEFEANSMEYCLFRCDLVKRSWIGLCCGNCQSFFGKWWLFAFIWVSNFVLPTSSRTPQLSLSQSTPSNKREHIALHMLVCLSVRPSVCLYVTFSFLIKYYSG